MATELVTDLSDADCNSAVSLTEFATYLSNRSGVADFPEDETVRTNALLDAMFEINALEGRFIGYRQVNTQTHIWPRVSAGRYRRRMLGVYVQSGLGAEDLNGRFWSASAWPQPIKDAQCEWAIDLVQNGLSGVTESEAIKAFHIGDVSVQLQPASSRSAGMPSRVRKLLNPFLVDARVLRS